MFSRNARLQKVLVFVSLSLLIISISPGIRLCSSAYAEPKISQGSIDILSKTGQAVAEIVEKVKPAIVNISSSKTIKTQTRPDPFFDEPFFRRFFRDESPFRAPKERKAFGLGSGVIVDAKGLILTSNHVIQGADEIKVTLMDKRELKGAQR